MCKSFKRKIIHVQYFHYVYILLMNLLFLVLNDKVNIEQ